MSFPFEFSKKRGDYDSFSPLVNLTGNAAIVAGVAAGLAVISYLALSALGFSSIATITVYNATSLLGH